MTSVGSLSADDFQFRPRAAWTAVFVFMVLYTFAYLDRQVLVLLVDPIRADLGITDFQISILQGAAFVIFYTLFGLPIGWAVDRYPRRWVVFFGILVWSVAAAAGGLAKNYWQLLGCRAGVGAGEASLHPSVYSTLADLFPKERLTSAMAVYAAGAAIGSGISLVVGGFVVTMASTAQAYNLPILGEVKPWQLVFLITGAPGLIIAFLVFLVSEPPRRGRIKTEATGASVLAVLPFMRQRWRFYVSHFTGFSLLAIMTVAYASWVPSHLIRAFGWSAQKTGTFLGIQTLLCLGLGGLAAGYAADALMRRGVKDAHLRLYVWCLVVFGVAGVVAMVTPNIVLAMICMTFVKFISPFLAVAAGALQITAPNQYRGQVSAVFLLVYNVVGQALGPMLAAGISDFIIGGAGDIGLAVSILFGVLTPITIAAMAFGMKPMREAVVAAERWD
jgi:MFS family permease